MLLNNGRECQISLQLCAFLFTFRPKAPCSTGHRNPLREPEVRPESGPPDSSGEGETPAG